MTLLELRITSNIWNLANQCFFMSVASLAAAKTARSKPNEKACK